MKILAAFFVALAMVTGAACSQALSGSSRGYEAPAPQNLQAALVSSLGVDATEVSSGDLRPPTETATASETPIPLEETDLSGSPELHDGTALGAPESRSPRIELPVQSTAAPLPEQSKMKTPAGAASVSKNSGADKASGDRLIIRDINVDAPLVSKGVDKTGKMPEPDGTDEVVFYNFKSLTGYGGTPGKGGNSVFGGHVDSGSKPCHGGTIPPPCPAVFWDLSKLKIGSEIIVRTGGASHSYRVRSAESVSERSNWSSILASTPKETITIITCDGDFNQNTRTYDRRLVVKAVRIT